MLGTMRVPESVKNLLKKAAFSSSENEKEQIVTTKVNFYLLLNSVGEPEVRAIKRDPEPLIKIIGSRSR